MIIEPANDNRHFIKIGECNRCGACCKLLPLWNNLSPNDHAMLRIVDPASEAVFKNTKNGWCSHLQKNPDGTYSCTIYDKRPDFCRAYPQTPNDLIPECCIKLIELPNHLTLKPLSSG